MTTWHQEFFAAVGKWPWLESLNDSVSGAVQPVYDRFRGNLAVELLHGGRWAGHALHPALSDLPIGFWSGSLLLDMVGTTPPPRASWTRRARSARRASRRRWPRRSPAWPTGR